MEVKNKVLVTGANGFVGSALLPALAVAGYSPKAVARKLLPDVDSVMADGLDSQTNWYDALRGCTHVVHLAARVHVMRDGERNPLSAYRQTNVDGTLNLAKQAAASGVRRFVFLSSVKVFGEGSLPGQPFKVDSELAPKDAYGVSKMEAEEGLFRISELTGMEVTSIRPPLVYGPGVKANFRYMMDWLAAGIPLPLGATQGLRSFVALPNLVDLIVTCLEHPSAANQVFLVSDGEDMSTTELLRRTARAMGRQPRLVAVPAGLLEFLGKTMGMQNVVSRLTGFLQVNIDQTLDLLGWAPRVSVDDALKETVAHYLAHSK